MPGLSASRRRARARRRGVFSDAARRLRRRRPRGRRAPHWGALRRSPPSSSARRTSAPSTAGSACPRCWGRTAPARASATGTTTRSRSRRAEDRTRRAASPKNKRSRSRVSGASVSAGAFLVGAACAFASAAVTCVLAARCARVYARLRPTGGGGSALVGALVVASYSSSLESVAFYAVRRAYPVPRFRTTHDTSRRTSFFASSSPHTTGARGSARDVGDGAGLDRDHG